MDNQYNVVLENISGNNYNGVLTWTSFESKEQFDGWYNEKLRSVYGIVEEGVSRERAIELCTTPEANLAVMAAGVKEIKKALDCALE